MREQMGSYYVFEKDGQLIGMTVNSTSEGDFFNIQKHEDK